VPDALGGSKLMKELLMVAKNHRTFYMRRPTAALLDILVHERSSYQFGPPQNEKSPTSVNCDGRERHDFSGAVNYAT